MNLVRWSPTTDLFNLHTELDRVFGDLTQSLVPAMTGQGTPTQGLLPLDIKKVDNALQIQASVPGFSPEEVSVTVDQGVLTIDAQRTQETENKDEGFVRKERYAGRLYRQIAIGEGVEGDKVAATFKDGVLTVTAPLLAKPEPKRIPVQASR
ncbi:MAG: hypothetical protein NVSMB17_12240 [Candidatus Dormibacteria bacterium]